MGHTDVVPVNADGWRRDPFGGELVDGEVWGRGAIDMLNLTATMAVATRRLAVTGFRPDGTLVFLAVADEEALGTWGADHLTRARARRGPGRLRDHRVGRDPGHRRRRRAALPVMVGEKGVNWCTIRVSGTPGHGSRPYATDNALVTAAEVVERSGRVPARRRASTTTWTPVPRRPRAGGGADADRCSTRPAHGAPRRPPSADGPQFHACTHTTCSPRPWSAAAPR